MSEHSESDTDSTVLELASDIWSAEEHQTMDTAVVEVLKGVNPPYQIMEQVEDAADLLFDIIAPCRDHMKDSLLEHRYSDHRVFLCESKELRAALAKAVENEQFARIRCLRVVRSNSEISEFLHNSTGMYARVLIFERGRENEKFGGLAKEYPVIPLNILDTGSRYSPPDRTVHKWFAECEYDPDDMVTRFTAFLAALFENVGNILEDPAKNIVERIANQKKLKRNLEWFMNIGRVNMRHRGPLRAEFYEEVLRRAIELYTYAAIKAPGSGSDPRIPEGLSSQPGQYPSEKLAAFLESSAKHALSALAPSVNSDSPKLLFVIENAHSLMSRLYTERSKFDRSLDAFWTRFGALRRALHPLRSLSIWCICAGLQRDFTYYVNTTPEGRRAIHRREMLYSGLLTMGLGGQLELKDTDSVSSWNSAVSNDEDMDTSEDGE